MLPLLPAAPPSPTCTCRACCTWCMDWHLAPWPCRNAQKRMQNRQSFGERGPTRGVVAWLCLAPCSLPAVEVDPRVLFSQDTGHSISDAAQRTLRAADFLRCSHAIMASCTSRSDAPSWLDLTPYPGWLDLTPYPGWLDPERASSRQSDGASPLGWSTSQLAKALLAPAQIESAAAQIESAAAQIESALLRPRSSPL